MKIIDQRDGLIDKASNDDGSILYVPIGNDRIIISGRDAHRGRYTDDGSAVIGSVWEAACELAHEVDAHNERWLDDARAASEASEVERVERLDKALKGSRGTYVDDNTF